VTDGRDAVPAPAPAVVFRGVAKAFGACLANADVTFSVAQGEIHALVGENGAGKSTAMKLLYGLHSIDAGEILVSGKPYAPKTPRDAIARGIGMVHQHFMLAGPFSGLDNIVLGAEPGFTMARFLPEWLRPIRRRAARERLVSLARENQFAVDFDAPVATLPVGVQQRLEILKLLYRDVDVLILDEPTAVLTPPEVEELFTNLKRLKARGKTIILITHKLNEVLAHADTVTVMRRGTVVGSRPTVGATEQGLAEMMVGRPVKLTATLPPSKVKADAAPALKVEGLSLSRGRGKPKLDGLTLAVRPGEILGIAGVEGNGQSALLSLIIDPASHFRGRGAQGLKVTAGSLEILGRDARRLGARAVRDLPGRVGVVPEDRHSQGLVLGFDLTANFVLGHHHRTPYARAGFLSRRSVRRELELAIKEFDVRPADPQATAGSLSGGNQQKVILAREFDGAPRLLLCAQPTRGVDVGSIEFIHERIIQAREAGCAVLLVSSALEEVTALSDRIVVFFEGRITGEFRRGEADERTLGRFMCGGGEAAGGRVAEGAGRG
jgi:simple sugar transport system ATP-binding protein